MGWVFELLGLVGREGEEGGGEWREKQRSGLIRRGLADWFF